ncbi:single-strand DNA-binding protein [Chitinophaga jiangningensis]|uniref:Single-stranded DNA-binding protein n=1 Tax=Chitinophaga jiangningensis TaxID=1419482 RepID=A0A1M6VAP7_9BACT|nr:single-strand DNA-binding protein [Chitinophaga jiangningensis]
MIKLQLIGHLGRDAVLREVNGGSVLSFTVAVNEKFRDKAGVLNERTTWVDCSMWDRPQMAPYLLQGTLVHIEGAPKADSYVSTHSGALSSILRLRVFSLQLLSRKDDEKRKAAVAIAPPVGEAVPEQETPADDLPF